MKQVRPNPRQRAGSEAGYTLLMIIFMVATMILFAAVAVPSVLTEGRRQREQESIWRGNQYVRAIRLYYQKNGKYPQTLSDLAKPSNAGTYYLRKQYKDLMNPSDGSWRMIYVSPSGQLIGSVRYHSLQEMALKLGMQIQTGNNLGPNGLPLPPGAAAAQSGQAAQGSQGTQGAAGSQTGQGNQLSPDQTSAQASGQGSAQVSGQANGQPNAQTGQPSQTPAASSAPGASSAAGASSTSAFSSSGFSSFGSSTQPAALAPLEPVDGPVLGGFLIGVGGKVKSNSQVVYQGGKSDYEWEFIWNPLTVVTAGSPAGIAGQTAAPATTAAPTSPFGFSGASGNPSSNSGGLPPMGATPSQPGLSQ